MKANARVTDFTTTRADPSRRRKSPHRLRSCWDCRTILSRICPWHSVTCAINSSEVDYILRAVILPAYLALQSNFLKAARVRRRTVEQTRGRYFELIIGALPRNGVED
jgi:hypothetical protein